MRRLLTGKPQDFANGILLWRRSHNFDNLYPWRTTDDPYAILVSELLLRKTTRKQVSEVVKTFLDKYPNISRLAESDTAEIEQAIRPLGISKIRSQLLKRLAVALEQHYGGKVPLDFANLIDLPGVGRYSANALLCMSGKEECPLVDTNTIRVVQRVFSNAKSRVKRPRNDLKLWEFVGGLIPSGAGREFNLGLLDFAANVCTPKDPKCFECPLSGMCDYYYRQNSRRVGARSSSSKELRKSERSAEIKRHSYPTDPRD